MRKWIYLTLVVLVHFMHREIGLTITEATLNSIMMLLIYVLFEITRKK